MHILKLIKKLKKKSNVIVISLLISMIIFSQIRYLPASSVDTHNNAIYRPIRIKYGYLNTIQIIVDRYIEKGNILYWLDAIVVFQTNPKIDIKNPRMRILCLPNGPTIDFKTYDNDDKFIMYPNNNTKLIFISYYVDLDENLFKKITSESTIKIRFMYNNGVIEEVNTKLSGGTVSTNLFNLENGIVHRSDFINNNSPKSSPYTPESISTVEYLAPPWSGGGGTGDFGYDKSQGHLFARAEAGMGRYGPARSDSLLYVYDIYTFTDDVLYTLGGYFKGELKVISTSQYFPSWAMIKGYIIIRDIDTGYSKSVS